MVYFLISSDLLISSLRTSIIITMLVFKVIFLCFHCVGIVVVVGWCGPGGDIMPWLLLFVFLHLHLGVWIWSDYRSRIQFLGFSLLSGCFLPLFLFHFWSSGWYDLWLSRGTSDDLDGFWYSPHLGMKFWLCAWPLIWVPECWPGFCLGYMELAWSAVQDPGLASGIQDAVLVSDQVKSFCQRCGPGYCDVEKSSWVGVMWASIGGAGNLTWFSGCWPDLWWKRRFLPKVWAGIWV